MNDDCTLLAALYRAVADLLWPSEIDAAVEVCVWSQRTTSDLSASQFLHWIGQPSATEIAEIGLEDCFAGVVAEQEWFGADERTTARRYQELLALLVRSLQALRVFRVGAVRMDLYVVGRAAGGEWMGLKTQVVET